MSDELHIRTANGSDGAAIAGFNAAMALESEGVTLDDAVLRAGVDAALADAGKAFYLLAEVGENPVGQLMVTTEWSDWRNGWIWWKRTWSTVFSVPCGREWRAGCAAGCWESTTPSGRTNPLS